MNKTDRQLAILLELQRRGALRAEDLAAAFETSVRTIYRDMQALSEAGVPVVGAPGQGYSLMEGYFLPPVSFTVDEAVALLIGTDFVEQKFDADYGDKARRSRAKIEGILPEAVRREALAARSSYRLLAAGESAASGQEKANFERLRRAILDKRKISFRYAKQWPAAESARGSVRTAAPYGLGLMQGSWMLLAHCDLRTDIRHFRLSRMSELSVLEERFDFPPGFSLQRYSPADDRRLPARVRIAPGIADKVKEAGSFFLERFEEAADGLHAVFRIRQPEDLLQWVLGWGANVVVLEPESLRRLVREEAENMLKRY